MPPKQALREADLYPVVKRWLEARGYEVKGEVGAADIVARKGPDTLIVELKLAFSLALFHQAIARQAITDLVYVALPPPKKGGADNIAMARRLGIGVLFVRVRDGHIDPVADPGPYRPRKSPKAKTRLLREFDRLRGDPNAGGATRHGIVTGYRQDALACARFLAVHGPSRGAKVAEWAEVPQATRIMAADHYGWFTRLDRGVYGLTPQGQKGLADWAEE